MPKKLSQSQIAKEVGVSQSLVSIVLNGRKEGIAPSTYERIWDCALKNGYSPKGMKLPEGKMEDSMRAVGYLLRAPLRLANKSNFFSHVAQGLHDFLTEHQVNLVFLGSETDLAADELRKADWRTKSLAGVVIMGEVAPDFLAAVRHLKVPLVYVSARSPGLCHSVNANEYEAGEQLVDHLFELGHRRFAILTGRRPKGRSDERCNAVKQALARHGIQVDERCVLALEDAERKEGYQMARDLLRSSVDPFPTAWVCINGLLARGAINRLYQDGLRVGRDISVVAFDNTRVCSEELPGITSASAMPEDLGREAGRILLNPQFQDTDPLLDVVLPSKFVNRETSGAAPRSIARRLQALSSSS